MFKILEMTQELEAVSYCIGMSLAGSLQQQNLGTLSPEIVGEAINDALKGNQLKYSPHEAEAIIQKFLKEQSETQFAANKEAGESFLKENASKEGVTITDSGLQYEVITEGDGELPSETSMVTVHYHGTLIDGTVFDSSVERGEPATFGVNQVIKGWTEALQLMKVGSKYRLFIPQDLAYGANPHPGGAIEPYMALVFEVELLSIA